MQRNFLVDTIGVGQVIPMKTESIELNPLPLRKKEAEAAAAIFLMERKHFAKPENKTLGQLADAFIASCPHVLSPSTIVGYQKIRRTAFQSIIDCRIGSLTKEAYQKAVDEYAKGRSYKTVLSAHVFYNKLLKDNKIFIGEGINLPQKEKESKDTVK